MPSIGENIKSHRKKMNLTQKELADKLFVTPQAVSRWEMNSAEPSLDTLREMAKLFNITVDELINGEDIKTKEEETKEELFNINKNISRSLEEDEDKTDPSIPIGKCHECGCDVYLNNGTRYEHKVTHEVRYLCHDCYKKDGLKYLFKDPVPLKKRVINGLSYFALILALLVTINHYLYFIAPQKGTPLDYFLIVVLIPYLIATCPFVVMVDNTPLSKYHKILWQKLNNLCFNDKTVGVGFIISILSTVIYIILASILLPFTIFVFPLLSGIFFPYSVYKLFKRNKNKK